MGKRDISKGITITDPRVLTKTIKLVEKACNELEKYKYNPSHIYTKSYFKTTK